MIDAYLCTQVTGRIARIDGADRCKTGQIDRRQLTRQWALSLVACQTRLGGAIRAHYSACILVEVVNGYDAFLHDAGRQCAVFVVPAVGRAVIGGQVPLGQVDVLADDVGRGTYLEVIEFVLVRYQIRVQQLAAVKGVEAHDKRLRGTLLVDRRFDVTPQCDDALLRIVVAHLVEDRIDLDVRDAIGARILAVEFRTTLRIKRLWIAVTVEPVADFVLQQACAFVIDAGILEGTTRYRWGTVHREGIGSHDPFRELISCTLALAHHVRAHGHLLEIGADLGEVHGRRHFDDLAEVEAILRVLGEAAGDIAEQRVTRQAAVPAAGLCRVDIFPHAGVAGLLFERDSTCFTQHVEWRCRHTLADSALRALSILKG